MKIEKINDSSLRFILAKEDLEERNMTVKDFITNSSKTQEFIRELMYQALEEFEFDGIDEPLIIEAAANLNDGVVITVSRVGDSKTETKISNAEEIKSLIPLSLGERKFRKADIEDCNDKNIHNYSNNINLDEDTDEPIKNYFTDDKQRNDIFERMFSEASRKTKFYDDKRIVIYSFDSIDILCSACERIVNIFSGNSSVYKYENKFYLILSNTNPNDKLILSDIYPILGEYGTHNQSNLLSEYFLDEHGEKIISENAVKKAALI